MRKTRQDTTGYSVHMYVSRDGLMRLLADVEHMQGWASVLVHGGGENNTMISVWITQSTYDTLVTKDLRQKYI